MIRVEVIKANQKVLLKVKDTCKALYLRQSVGY